MASDPNANDGNSPMQLGMTGQFLPEDIQELLGVMGDGNSDHGGEVITSTDNVAASFAQAGNSLSEERRNSSSASSNQPGEVSGASFPGEEAKAQARSERKRSREKQRRSDVNKQFADLTQLLQKIDAEDVSEEDAKNGTTSASRVTFNPSNRVDLIGRTIVLLERLHEANKRRKTEINSVRQQLDEAKKAGEDTAAKLKEALLAPPGQPMNKQFMMMVPMMMSSDGTGVTQGVPMMNPYMHQAAMPQAAMPQAFCPMPAHPMAAPVAAAPQAAPPAASSSSAHAPAAAPPVGTQAGTAIAPAATSQQQGQAPQHQQMPPNHPAYSYMMPAPMAGGGYMMPMANPMGAGQPMAMMGHPQGMHALPTPDPQNGRQDQKDSSPASSGNLAHCA